MYRQRKKCTRSEIPINLSCYVYMFQTIRVFGPYAYGPHGPTIPFRMTGSSMANGCDMTGSQVIGNDVIFLRFFTIVLVQNVSLGTTGSNTVTSREVTS